MSATNLKTVTRYSSRGRPYEIWAPMPRVPDEFIDCVVYLYPDLACADSGAPLGGTGFVLKTVGVRDPSIEFFHVVTNKHVIARGHTTVRFNTHEDGHESFEYPADQWEKSAAADLAVCLLPNVERSHLKFEFVTPGMFMTRAEMAQYDIGMGSEVFFVGRFINAEGKDKNRPSLRFATIAQTDPHIIDGEEKLLVEARSIPEFSGSPVFVYALAGVSRGVFSAGLPSNYMGPWLVGVDCEHISDWLRAMDDRGNDLPFQIQSNSGMMGVVPIWYLDALMNGEKMKNNRAEQERRIIAGRAATKDAACRSGVPDSEDDVRHSAGYPGIVEWIHHLPLARWSHELCPSEGQHDRPLGSDVSPELGALSVSLRLDLVKG